MNDLDLWPGSIHLILIGCKPALTDSYVMLTLQNDATTLQAGAHEPPLPQGFDLAAFLDDTAGEGGNLGVGKYHGFRSFMPLSIGGDWPHILHPPYYRLKFFYFERAVQRDLIRTTPAPCRVMA